MGVLVAVGLAVGAGACSASAPLGSPGSGADALVEHAPPQVDSAVADGAAPEVVARDPDADPGAPTWCGRGTDVSGATPAPGFCIKEYAQIGEARAMVMAPNGDLFVASPSTPTAGGASGGLGAIILLTDVDHDGLAEVYVFANNLADVHGLALGNGYLYYTTQDTVFRTPYAAGQTMSTGAAEDLKLPAVYSTGGRWTHGLALSHGGTLYTSRGEYASCPQATSTGQPAPMGGDISTIGADGSLTQIATGFRNPMYLRCHRTDEVCAGMELGEDLLTGAREKMLMLHPDTNYGFPCCTTAAMAIPDATAAMCNTVTKEDASFPLSDTPFGFDWEPGSWPAPFTNAVFVALHGSAYSTPAWQGAAVVYAATDPTTHVPVQDWQPFQTGFGPGGSMLDRPSDVVFSSDGRIFIADDTSGHIYWMAPTAQPAPTN